MFDSKYISLMLTLEKNEWQQVNEVKIPIRNLEREQQNKPKECKEKNNKDKNRNE